MKIINTHDQLTDRLSDEVHSIIEKGVGSLRKVDRMGVTICVLLNAIRRSPDISGDLKDELREMITGVESVNPKTGKKYEATIKEIYSHAELSEEQAKAIDIEAMHQMASEMSLEMMFALLRRLMHYKISDETHVSPLILMAMFHLLVTLDEVPGASPVSIGYICGGVLEGLTAAKANSLLAA